LFIPYTTGTYTIETYRDQQFSSLVSREELRSCWQGCAVDEKLSIMAEDYNNIGSSSSIDSESSEIPHEAVEAAEDAAAHDSLQ
jgi:hypothetical protein